MSFVYISRIEIQNFRNVHGLKADLPPSVVFVGENRSGKSNLMHALRLVLDPSLPDSARELRAEDFWDGLDAPFGGESVSVQIDLQGFDGEDAESVLADCIVSDSPMTARLTYLFRPRHTLDEGSAVALTEDDYEHTVFGGDDEAHGVGREVRWWLALTLLPAMRDAETQLMGARRPLLQPLLDRVRPLLDLDVLNTVRDELEAAGEKLLEETPLKNLQKRINDQITDIVGNHLSVAASFGFAGSDSEQLLRSLRLYLEDGKTRPISDASLGTANVLYLSLLMQDLDERREKRDSAGTVLAIEEPEAHLHPHLQRLLFRYALRREHSVMVTTHSPHIASVAPLGSIAVLRCEGESHARQSQIYSTAGLELSDEHVADLERYLDVTRAELLFSRGIILVEGAAEEYLVPAFARFEMERAKLGSSLDELGITVCSVAGTDFAPYWRVTSKKGWDIARVIVTDGDPDPEKANVLDGLVRGARLLGDSDLLEHAKSGKILSVLTVRPKLETAGIFVGNATLESDLIATMADEMYAAFAEILGPNRKGTIKRFENALKAGAGDEVVDLIDKRVGKGRFAQRLASKVTAKHVPPRHLQAALQRIFKLVSHA